MPDKLDLIRSAGGLSRRGQLPAFTSIGSYTLIYLTKDCETLCADCATAEYLDWLYALNTCDGWQYDPPVLAGVYWEGPDDYCANCNKPIPSSYGDPDAE